ncbi:hypothetical protein ES703_84901 [subsurface metagenome]
MAAGNSAITDVGAYSPLVGSQVCKGIAPALVMAAVISKRNAIIGTAEVVASAISEMTNVPENTQISAMPRRRAASDAPIIAKLFVAAKLEFLPPVVIKRYNEAVTISQNISKNSK